MNKKLEHSLKKVEILVNWQCNQRCIFCSVGHKLVSDGSSFEEKVAGLNNLEDFGIDKRTSTVINKYNYHILPEMARFLLKFKKNTKSYHLNFAIPDGFAKQNFERMVPRMGEAAPALVNADKFVLQEY